MVVFTLYLSLSTQSCGVNDYITIYYYIGFNEGVEGNSRNVK